MQIQNIASQQNHSQQSFTITSVPEFYSSIFNPRKDRKGSKLHKNIFSSVQLKLSFECISQSTPNLFVSNNFTEEKVFQLVKQSMQKMYGKIGLSHLLACLEIKYVSEVEKWVDIELINVGEDILHQFLSAMFFGTAMGNNKSYKITIKDIKAVLELSTDKK